MTAVEYIEHMWTLQVAIYKEDIDKALEMQEQQMIDHISFGAGLKKSMEEIVYEKIKNGLEELVKQGKLKNYTNYKSE